MMRNLYNKIVLGICLFVCVLVMTSGQMFEEHKGIPASKRSGWCPWSAWNCEKPHCFYARRRRCLCSSIYNNSSDTTCHKGKEEVTLTPKRCRSCLLANHMVSGNWCPWKKWSSWMHFFDPKSQCRSKQRYRRRLCRCPSMPAGCFTGSGTEVDRWHKEHPDPLVEARCRLKNSPPRWCAWSIISCPMSCKMQSFRRHRVCACPPPRSASSKSTKHRTCSGNSTSILHCPSDPLFCHRAAQADMIGEAAYPFGLKMFFILCALLFFLTVLLILRHRRRLMEHRAAARRAHQRWIMQFETCVRPNEVTCRLTSSDQMEQQHRGEPPRYEELLREGLLNNQQEQDQDQDQQQDEAQQHEQFRRNSSTAASSSSVIPPDDRSDDTRENLLNKHS